MDEKILQAYCGVSITPVERYRKALEMANGDEQFFGFILGYRAALDALPSREEVKRVIKSSHYEKPEYYVDRLIDAIMALFQGGGE